MKTLEEAQREKKRQYARQYYRTNKEKRQKPPRILTEQDVLESLRDITDGIIQKWIWARTEMPHGNTREGRIVFADMRAWLYSLSRRGLEVELRKLYTNKEIKKKVDSIPGEYKAYRGE